MIIRVRVKYSEIDRDLDRYTDTLSKITFPCFSEVVPRNMTVD